MALQSWILFIWILIIIRLRLCQCVSVEDEPTCMSRFDYEFKVVKKLVALENENEKLRVVMERLTDEINAVDAKSLSTEMLAKQLGSIASLDGTGSTFIRWGRTSCPSNGTELVYEGYAGGSWYGDKGAAAEFLCLPREPIWGTYDDEVNEYSASVHGTEYQTESSRNSKSFFGKDLLQNDAPCAVCRTKRSSVVMIPARNQCYSGWTREYHGYLMGGLYKHDAASQFICLDVNAEVLAKGGQSEDGKLLYYAEARCGSLRCPPYVNGRELTCVMCSK